MFLRSRVVGIIASSPRAYPFTWHVWRKGMGCRVCGFDSSAWIVCIYRWRVRLVMNTTFLEKAKLSLNLGVVILCQNSLGGGCTAGAPLISDLLPRWLYALLQFRFIWCCFGLGCAMPSFSWWLGKRSAYLVVCAPPTWGPVTLHRLQTLLLRERENLLASATLGLSDHLFTSPASPRDREQATVEKGCEKGFFSWLKFPRALEHVFGASTVVRTAIGSLSCPFFVSATFKELWSVLETLGGTSIWMDWPSSLWCTFFWVTWRLAQLSHLVGTLFQGFGCPHDIAWACWLSLPWRRTASQVLTIKNPVDMLAGGKANARC